MPATLRVPVAGWPKKRELGPLSSGQGKSMQFVDPDRIEQSDHVQAASFAPLRFFSYSFTASDGSEKSTAGRVVSPCSIIVHRGLRSV